MTEQQNAKIEGWYVVELLGHGREVGYVTTVYFGNQAMFQIDSPAVPERDVVLAEGAFFGNEYLWKGSKVRKARVPDRSRIVSSAAIFAFNPSTEQDITAEIGGNGPISEVIEKGPETNEIPF